MGVDFDPLFEARVRSFGSVYQVVTRMTQDPNLSIAYVKEIVLGF